MNLTKNFASRRQSWRDSRQDRAESFATVNLHLRENLGEICGNIPARFWPPGLLLLARILVRFAAGSRRDFGRRDFCFPARILVRFAAGSRRDFGHRDYCFPARILIIKIITSSWIKNFPLPNCFYTLEEQTTQVSKIEGLRAKRAYISNFGRFSFFAGLS